MGNIQYNYWYNESAIAAHLQRFATHEADVKFYVLNRELSTLFGIANSQLAKNYSFSMEPEDTASDQQSLPLGTILSKTEPIQNCRRISLRSTFICSYF
jgi:hypothetical protein